jgi:hypothetical protein
VSERSVDIVGKAKADKHMDTEESVLVDPIASAFQPSRIPNACNGTEVVADHLRARPLRKGCDIRMVDTVWATSVFYTAGSFFSRFLKEIITCLLCSYISFSADVTANEGRMRTHERHSNSRVFSIFNCISSWRS